MALCGTQPSTIHDELLTLNIIESSDNGLTLNAKHNNFSLSCLLKIVITSYVKFAFKLGRYITFTSGHKILFY